MNFQDYQRNVTSQFGEDGILEAIFDRLNVSKGLCVEFGAWDGKQHSNTYNLIVNHGWRGILIEANVTRFSALVETYRDRSDVIPINRIVGFESPNTLDEILQANGTPHEIDFVSIDIDGNDYHVFEAMQVFLPKVVVIEFNPTMPNEFQFVQLRDLRINHGSSLRSITELAKKKGYELIATTECNAVYVRREFFLRMEVIDNSLSVLHASIRRQAHVVQLYDGTLMLIGTNRLLWHEPPVKIEVPQVLPSQLRKFPDALDEDTLQEKGSAE